MTDVKELQLSQGERVEFENLMLRDRLIRSDARALQAEQRLWLHGVAKTHEVDIDDLVVSGAGVAVRQTPKGGK